MQEASKPVKAYSYLRFSTPEQQKGDSHRRQSTMAIEYCLRHNLELDRDLTFQDLGVSAFKGANSESGRLADFREAVDKGVVPVGSYLLVEGLDRLSRLAPRRAIRVLESIVDMGIVVVTLNDEKCYTPEKLDEDGGLSLLTALITFMRANEESVTKGRRVAAAWEQKRRKVVSDPSASYTKQLPFWLKSRWETNEYVDAINDIYRLYADGYGHLRIVQYLNQHYKPLRSVSWSPTLIKKSLISRAVEGHLRVNTGALLENIFPVVVDPVLVAKVRTIQATTTKAGRALATVDRAGDVAAGTTVHSYAGLLKCTCGATAVRVNKGAHQYLVCAAAKLGRGCVYKSFPYAKAVELLNNVSEYDLEAQEVLDVIGYDQTLQDAARESYELLKLNRNSLVAQKRWEDAERAWRAAREEIDAAIIANSGAGRIAFSEALNEFLAGKRTNAVLRRLFKSGVVSFQNRSITLVTHGNKEISLKDVQGEPI